MSEELKKLHEKMALADSHARETCKEQSDIKAHARTEMTAADARIAAAKADVADARTELYRSSFEAGVITEAAVNVLAPTHDPHCTGHDRDICVRCWMLCAIEDPGYITSERLALTVYQERM